MNNNIPTSTIIPPKTPEYDKYSPQIKVVTNLDQLSNQKVYPNPNNYYPMETHHIYHSPLKAVNHLNNSTTQIRYISPAKINESDNSQFVSTKYLNIDAENFHYIKSENEKLRFMLKEKQDELYSFMAKCAHLERHVKDPTYLIKLEENELRLQAIIKENQRLHEDLAIKQNEIESWKNSFTRIEANMSEKINDFENVNNELRVEIENWKKQYAELQKNLQLKDEMFMKFLNESKGEREEKAKKASQDSDKKQEILNESQCNELIEKMNTLIKENEKLHVILDQKISELENFKNLLNQQNYELEQWKTKFSKLNYSYEELKKKEFDEENKISKLTAEIENINNLLRTKLSMMEEMKSKYLKMGQMSEKLKEYKDKIYYLTDDNIKLNSLTKAKSLEIEKIKETVYKLETQLASERNNIEDLKTKQLKIQSLEESISFKNQKLEFENHISILKSENERLNELINKLNIQMEDLQGENSKMEFFKSENMKLTQNLQEISLESTNLRNQYLDNHKLIQKNQEQHGLIVIFFAEIETLRHRISEKEEELQNLKNKIYMKK